MSGPDPWHKPGGLSDLDAAQRVEDDGPTYDPRTDTYVGSFETIPASVAVTKALADIRHCEPTDLEPLYRSVDPDALDRLVDSGTAQLRVRMDVDGFEVLVTGGRRLEITPPSA